MPWPKQVLTSEGLTDYTSPVENVRKGAIKKAGWEDIDDWRGMSSDEGISLWNIRDNPVWESAAKATGMDWDVLTKSFPDRNAYNVRKDAAVKDWMSKPENYNPSTLGGLSPGQAILAQALPEYQDAEHEEWIADYEEGWGLDSREGPQSATFINNMNTMNDWIKKTVKNIDDIYPDADIINEGPTAEQYGLEGGTDPWEFYGLDKLPRILPKELDVNYEFNLMDAKPSSATYRTPKGYPKIDLSSVETAEVGSSFTDYLADYDFAQEHGYFDFDLGNTGDANYQKELEFIFGDAAGDVRIFGQADYDNLANQGLSKDEIEQAILRRTEDGQKLIFGPKMAKLFDRYAYDPRWWGQEADTVGQKGVRLLRLQGLDDAGIMNRYAKGSHGSKIGQWVKDNFGIRIAPETGMYDYYFMDPGDKKSFGMKDYNQFLNQGMDPERIKVIAQELVTAGWILGDSAREKLGLQDYQAQYQGAMQSGHLGGQVVDALTLQGYTKDQLQVYGESKDVITIGSEAAEELYGWTDKGDIGSFGMKDIHENWPDGDHPSGLILAKIAAGNAEAIGSDAVDYIWGHEVYDVHMKPPVGADPSHFTFGMDTINYLRAKHPAASSNEALRAIAKGAHWIGEAAAKELGIPANKPPIKEKTIQQVLSTPMSEYDKPDLITGNTGGFGQQEIDWMTAAKWNPDQMRAVTDQFDRIGPAAAKQLWGEKLTSMMPAPHMAVDPNKTTFGMETIKYLDSIDPGISDKSLAAIARGTADYVGEGALKYFADEGIDVGKESAPIRGRDLPTQVEKARPEWVDQGGQGGFGSADMNWLRDHGYSQDEMRGIASKQGKIGEKAAKELWGYTDPGTKKGWFGQADYDQLKRHGASDDIMRKIIRGMGLQLGDKMKWLG